MRGGATARRTAGARRRSPRACSVGVRGTAPSTRSGLAISATPGCAATSGPELVAHALDPGADRHGEALLRSEGLAGRQVLRQPLPQQPLALCAAAPSAHRAGGSRPPRCPGSRNGVRPSTPCAIRQRSSLISRSFGSQSATSSACAAISRVRPGLRRRGLGRGDAVAPAGEQRGLAQHVAEPVEGAMRARPPCRPATRAASRRGSGHSRRGSRRRPRRRARPSPPPARGAPGTRWG